MDITPFFLIVIFYVFIGTWAGNFIRRIKAEKQLDDLNEDLDQVANALANADERDAITSYHPKDARLLAIYEAYKKTFLSERLNSRVNAMRHGHRNDVSA